jgi:ribosomal-protein-alanine acetyltransferase
VSEHASSDIEVVPALATDADAIRALDGLSDSTRRLLDHDLVAPDRCCLVARLVGQGTPTTGEVVGFASALLQLEDAHVLDIAVASGVRRRGIGRRLLRTLVARVRGRGATAVTLEVRPSNDASRPLYEQLGFVEEGRRPRYYPDGEDALLLWLRDLDAVADLTEVG